MGHSQVKLKMFNYAKHLRFYQVMFKYQNKTWTQEFPIMVCMITWYLYQQQIELFELVVTAPENDFEKCSNDPFKKARSNCSGA